MPTEAELQSRSKVLLVGFAFFLLSLFLLSLLWLTTDPLQTLGLTLAYASGVSMIVLPCTLPLVFIVVPLCMGQAAKKGLLMALLFGAGLTVTMVLYAVAVATAGAYAGVSATTLAIWAIAGGMALLFGLWSLGMVRFKIPTYTKTPKFIQQKGNYGKSFLFGLFLGNLGVACPNPAFYVLMTGVAASGSAATGALYGAIHGIGRVTPLLFFAVLAILGVNATRKLVEHRESVERATGWGLVGVGALLLTIGLFGMTWWDSAWPHRALDDGIHWLSGGTLGELSGEFHLHSATGFEPVAPWFLVGVVATILAARNLMNWREVRRHRGVAPS